MNLEDWQNTDNVDGQSTDCVDHNWQSTDSVDSHDRQSTDCMDHDWQSTDSVDGHEGQSTDCVDHDDWQSTDRHLYPNIVNYIGVLYTP